MAVSEQSAFLLQEGTVWAGSVHETSSGSDHVLSPEDAAEAGGFTFWGSASPLASLSGSDPALVSPNQSLGQDVGMIG